jgi:CCR4-NOT transcription complex subunit 3
MWRKFTLCCVQTKVAPASAKKSKPQKTKDQAGGDSSVSGRTRSRSVDTKSTKTDKNVPQIAQKGSKSANGRIPKGSANVSKQPHPPSATQPIKPESGTGSMPPRLTELTNAGTSPRAKSAPATQASSPIKAVATSSLTDVKNRLFENSMPLQRPAKRTRNVPKDYDTNLALLKTSLQHIPTPKDTDRPKQYVPRNPYRTPASFPSVPAAIFDDSAIFQKFSMDTLFFIFYFQQGTQHQYLAARELKAQSWRYHKNYLTWFQRHDSPMVRNSFIQQFCMFV